MTVEAMKKLSLAEIRAQKDAGKLHVAPDAPTTDLPDEFWAHAQVVERENKKSVHLRLEPEVFRYFQETGQGKGHIKRMQDVLAAYVRAQQKASTR
ncbi:hypothetical protein [Neogemmobacter tilapiae]|uniref:3-oxoacyl-ACP synthase n=1 Tax=Neogemmobacter tilapiae TaxID=875041 RepID=A0A918TMZ1_9RHOB|nr:hypothetical protein [Gemmobacter tilapiae]GHC55512.1 hypothetical protein GCM10007315_18090 [Gemmobacter tilapiae]